MAVVVVAVVAVYLSIHPSIYLPVYLHVWKRSYSGRLPQFLILTTSEAQQVRKTSSIFQVGNIKNEAILQDILQKWKVECRAGTNAFCFFSTPWALLEVDMSKKRTPLWREAYFEVKSAKNWRVRTTLGRSDAVSRGRRKGLCTLSKVRKREGFVAFPKTMAGVGHWKRICKDVFQVAGAIQETCLSEMFGGQSGGFLRGVAWGCILEHEIFRFAKFAMILTAAALRVTWRHFYTSKCASRHNGVHFFISHLARWLRTRRFSEPTFRPSGATHHWENTMFRAFSTFSRIFFPLTFSSLIFFLLLFSSLLWLFPPLLFHLSILSEVWLLNFLRLSHLARLFHQNSCIWTCVLWSKYGIWAMVIPPIIHVIPEIMSILTPVAGEGDHPPN